MRKYYLDNIRWITVVLVVIYHVIYMYNAEGILGVLGKITDLEVQYYDAYQYLVYPWFMFLLFIVSGICARLYLERHTDREFIRSRTTKLLVPSTVGVLAFQFVQGYLNMRLSNAYATIQNVPAPFIVLITLASGIGVLWYIQVLWLFSLLLLPLRKLEKDRLWTLGARTSLPALLMMTAAVWGAAQIGNTPVICVYRFGYYALAFLSGYFVFSHEEVIGLLKRWFAPLLAAAAVLGVAFCVVFFGRIYADAPVNRTPLFTSYGWFASLAFLGGAAKHLDGTNRFASWMSRHSWGLYVFHYLGISAVAVFVGARHILPAALVYALSLLTAFALAFALYEIISRTPFFRWAVLGIRKERSGDVS